MDLTLLVFLLVYVAMGFGQLPGFRVDRTGAAIIGMLAMLVAGSITPQAAWNAIDYRTIGMLFGLMVVAAAFMVSGFYAWTAERIAALEVRPPVLLAVLILTGGVLSSVLTNDVIAVAMTPLLVSATLARRLNPVPFLLGFCFATNIGSAATLIGSPHNMIVGQTLQLSFTGFLGVALLPSLLALPVTWGIVAFLYRGRWQLAGDATATAKPQPAVALDRWETIKAGVVATAVILAFVFSPWPRELIALAAAGVLLMNRKIASGDVLSKVDYNLILLVVGLFVVNAAFAATGVPQALVADLRNAGLDLHDLPILLWVVAVVSDIIGNNPTVMLLLPLLHSVENPEALGAVLSLGTSFSGNVIVFGSLAGIITVEQAAANGIRISLGEFARVGAPVTVACMAIATAWIAYLAA
jgi:Na+/H+ antiporter NhaD/arsenite permease-like protein